MKAILLPTLQGTSFWARKVGFWGRKVDKKSILDPKVDLKSKKVDFKYRFFHLKFLDSHSFDGFKGFKCVEATQNKIRKTIFDKPRN